MEEVSHLLLRATGLVVLAFAASASLGRAAAATRRHLWVGTMFALLLLPALCLKAPPLRLAVLPAPAAGRSAPPIPPPATVPALVEALPMIEPPPPPARPGGPAVLTAVYLAGVALSLVRLFRVRRRAARLIRGAGPAGPGWPSPAGIVLRETDALRLPVTVGSWRPVVLVPVAGRAWPPDWRRAVVDHEVAHVRGRDPLWQLVGELTCALYWFHPLVHLAMRRLRIERELAADDQILAGGMAPSAYAQLLFELACVPETPAPLGAVVPLLTPGGLRARVLAALRPGRRRRGSVVTTAALALLGTAAFVPLAAGIPVSRGHAPGPVIGQLVDQATGRPVPFGEVAFQLSGIDRQSAVVASDAGGWFRYPGELPWAQTFDVYARAGTRAARNQILAVPYGTALPTRLELRPASTLAGTLRWEATGRPSTGATVQILDDRSYAPGPHRRVLAVTDREGRWRIDGMLYGRFELLFVAPGGGAASATVDVGDGGQSLPPIDRVIPAAWPVSGWVRDQAGKPVAGVRVDNDTTREYWVDSDGLRLARVQPGQRHIDWDRTASDGSFRLLSVGRRLEAVGRSDAGALLYGASPQGLGLHPPLTLTVAPTARVEGIIRDGGGHPLRGVYVAAMLLPAFGAPSRKVGVSSSDAGGRFAVEALPAREVTLLARQGDVGSERRLTLHPGETARVEITLDPTFTPGSAGRSR